MQYQLKTIYRTIYKELPSALLFTEKEKYISYLEKQYQKYVVQYRIQFQKEKTYKINEVETIHMSQLLPEWATGHSSDQGSELAHELWQQFEKQRPVTVPTLVKLHYYQQQDQFYLLAVCQASFSELPVNLIEFLYYQEFMRKESERIVQVWQQQMFSFKSEKKLQLFVQNYQRELDTLASVVLNYLPPEEKTKVYQIAAAPALEDIYKIIYTHLELLLSYIEAHFTKYLDMNTRLPYQSRIIASLGFLEKVSFIEKKLAEFSINDQLLSVLSEPLKKLSSIKEDNSLTYLQLVYYRRFLHGFKRLFTKKNYAITELDIEQVLLEMNYNADKFFTYITESINLELKQKEQLHEKIELLYQHLKRYNHLRSKVHHAYCDLPPIRQQLTNWLEVETEYYNKLIAHEISQISKTPISKIETPLSVPQVAYFLRIQCETGMITSKPAKTIHTSSEIISTTFAKEISLKSIHNDYYEVKDYTKKAVRSKILQLLQHIDASQHNAS